MNADIEFESVLESAEQKLNAKQVPLKYLFRRAKVNAAGSEELLSLYRDYGVIPKSSREDNHNRASEDLSKYQRVKRGDLVVNKMKAWQGSLAISEFSGIVSPAYFVYQPAADLPTKYFHYLLRSAPYIHQFRKLSSGVRPAQWDLDPAAFSRLPVILPSRGTANAIAEFLDRETAEIDAFIADQERLIELLEERRTATITHAVTRGLDPNVPMKDSGIDWLATTQIPATWRSWKMSHLLRLQSGDSLTSQSIEESGAYPVYGGGGFRGYTDTFTNDGDHALIGRQGALCGNIKQATGKFFATEHAIVVYPLQELNTLWLTAILQTMNLGQYSQSAAQPGISVEVISQKKLPVPPLREQHDIADFLDHEISEIDAAVSDAREAIALSRERRAALISAAVTGQLDVSQAQRPVDEALEEEVRV